MPAARSGSGIGLRLGNERFVVGARGGPRGADAAVDADAGAGCQALGARARQRARPPAADRRPAGISRCRRGRGRSARRGCWWRTARSSRWGWWWTRFTDSGGFCSASMSPSFRRARFAASRYLQGAFRRGLEVWPVFSLSALLAEPGVPEGGGGLAGPVREARADNDQIRWRDAASRAEDLKIMFNSSNRSRNLAMLAVCLFRRPGRRHGAGVQRAPVPHRWPARATLICRRPWCRPARRCEACRRHSRPSTQTLLRLQGASADAQTSCSVQVRASAATIIKGRQDILGAYAAAGTRDQLVPVLQRERG